MHANIPIGQRLAERQQLVQRLLALPKYHRIISYAIFFVKGKTMNFWKVRFGVKGFVKKLKKFHK